MVYAVSGAANGPSTLTRKNPSELDKKKWRKEWQNLCY